MPNVFKSAVWRAALAILLFSALTRFVALDKPSRVVFDEVHFGKFTNSYCCTGRNIFDIHPPHAKLSIAAFEQWFSDYDGSLSFKNINDSYASWSPEIFRAVPAFAGTFIPLLAFLLVLQLGGSVGTASLVALALIFENGLLLQSRIIALDSQLLLGELTAIVAALAACRQHRRSYQILWWMTAGIAAAWAVGSKFTGLVAFSIPLVVWCHSRLTARRDFFPQSWRNLIWFFAAATAVYLSGWYLHFALLSKNGVGDAYYHITGNFLTDVVRLHKVMISSNANLSVTHSYGSKWFSWPIMARGLYYWGNEGRHIYFLGNPVVWVGSFVVLVTSVMIAGLSRCSFVQVARPLNGPTTMGWLPLLAFLNAYLPYSLVKRDLFLYHYLPPLMFLTIWAGLWLQKIGFCRVGSFNRQSRAYWGLIGLIVVGFVGMLPLTGGLKFPAYFTAILDALPHWR